MGSRYVAAVQLDLNLDLAEVDPDRRFAPV
jgi:hypothetical protein